ncbi:MAG TPA: hypothetical protein VMU14_07285, partial [Acidimicrobiales bacterium]|nr:hypothetical protein [Acidimicrobiales bacterium]
YTAVGGKIAVWNQPRETRAMYKDGRWTPEEIEAHLGATVGFEEMPFLADIERRRQAAEASKPAAAPAT